ncbi:MAG: phosphoribosylanthranilate isomerase [Acidobacteriota bacterium]
MTFIKICGITNLEDALQAVDAGADALGFNFVPQSPRYIEPTAARKIIDKLPKQVVTVGVFVNEDSPERVALIADVAGVSALQLHGDESPDYCRALSGRYVIKTLAVRKDFDPQTALAYEVDVIMLDAFDPQMRGGTGNVIDWSLARAVRDLVPRVMLAGGLSPENIGRAIGAVDPYGADACSALETSPGKKNTARVRAFLTVARAAALAVKR